MTKLFPVDDKVIYLEVQENGLKNYSILYNIDRKVSETFRWKCP